MQEDKLKDALLKVALGFSLEEVTEEYGVEDGELKLVKRRETRKDVPPDLKAAKLLLEEKDYSALTDEELSAEKKRLLKQLKENYDDGTRKKRKSRSGSEKSGGETEEGAGA